MKKKRITWDVHSSIGYLKYTTFPNNMNKSYVFWLMMMIFTRDCISISIHLKTKKIWEKHSFTK